MFKLVLVATAAFAIAGSSIAYAQQRFGGPGDAGPRLEHRRPSVDDVKAFADARIAALKAGLELTADQEKNWPAFEQALRDMVKLRIDRIEARRAREAAGTTQSPTNPFDRLQRRADFMAKRSAALKRIADAGAPLYMSLNDDQKQRFTKLSRMLRPHHHFRHFGMNSWRRGEGFDRDGGSGWRGREGRRFGEGDGQFGGRMHQLMQSEDEGSRL
jgi:zinc resistance-associated protein